MSADPARDPLTAVEATLSLFDDAGADDFVGGRLMRASLERTRAQLLASRLQEAPQTSQSLDLALESRDSANGADLKVVATVLSALQGTLDAVATAAQRTPRGGRARDRRAAVRMRVAFAVPGSLGLRIVPAALLEEHSLFSDSPESLVATGVDEILDVLDLAQRDEMGAAFEHLTALGPVASRHLRRLTQELSRSNTQISAQWRSKGSARAVRLSHVGVERLVAAFEEGKTVTAEVQLPGRLIGGNLMKRTFGFLAADGSTHSGQVDPPVVGLLEQFFGDDCVATMNRIERRLPTGEAKTTWILRDLARPEENRP